VTDSSLSPNPDLATSGYADRGFPPFELPSVGRPLRLGTRASPLAMAQARMAAASIARAHGLPADAIAIRAVQTVGDKVLDRPLAEIGGKALWTKELDGALIEGEIDFAVHSMKDVETLLAQGIMLAAVLERADPRDRLIGVERLSDLSAGAVVGTSSPRRTAQLLNRRPDLKVESLRGNVQSRLKAIADGRAAATFLAAAGLDRLGIEEGSVLDLGEWLPAASQGIIGLACRADDQKTAALLMAVNHGPTMGWLEAERAVLEGLGGSCHTSVAVHASGVGEILLRAELLSPDGTERLDETLTGDGEPRALGLALASALMARATPAIRASLGPVAPGRA
jgi:hydroxymethylbilane synthase